MPITVAPSSGHWVDVTASSAASRRRLPRITPVSMPSATTMALSTSMPIAMISAPREMRSISMANMSMKKTVPATVRKRALPTVSPARHPMKTQSTPTTIAIDRARLNRKELIASSTTMCCW